MANKLFSLEQVKKKLDIPSDDLDMDDEISWVMEAVNTWLLNMTGIDLDGGNTYAEVHRNIQVGRYLRLKWRPVASVASVSGRFIGGTDQQLTYDLFDTEDGTLAILGGAEFREWPPVQIERPVWFRWREVIWPFVTVNYTTSAMSLPLDLSDAGAAIAAAYWDAQKSGLKTYSALGSIIERYGNDPIPPYCLPILRRYQNRKVYGTV